MLHSSQFTEISSAKFTPPLDYGTSRDVVPSHVLEPPKWPVSFDVPRAPMSTKWPCPQGWLPLTHESDLSSVRDTLLITCPNWLDTNYTISLRSHSHVSLFGL